MAYDYFNAGGGAYDPTDPQGLKDPAKIKAENDRLKAKDTRRQQLETSDLGAVGGLKPGDQPLSPAKNPEAALRLAYGNVPGWSDRRPYKSTVTEKEIKDAAIQTSDQRRRAIEEQKAETNPYEIEAGIPEWATSAIEKLRERRAGPSGQYVAGQFGNYEDARQRQLDLAGQLQAVGSGEAPTVAERLAGAAQDRLRAQALSQLQSGAQTPGARRAALLGLSSGSANIAQQASLQAAQERERYLDSARTALGNVGIQDTQALNSAVADQGQGRDFASNMEKISLGTAGLGIEDKQGVARALQLLDQTQESSRLSELGADTQQRLADQQRSDQITAGVLGFFKDLGLAAIGK